MPLMMWAIKGAAQAGRCQVNRERAFCHEARSAQVVKQGQGCEGAARAAGAHQKT